ncbi:MAG: SpoIID/LytB domain-containing protein, partial [Prevotellaceae bacterium]|nr:SpoIID/LytB domain-containing protein [Prevotellaceae bacterium]
MQNTIPTITVGILSDTAINFVLCGNFVCQDNTLLSGEHKVSFIENKIKFQEKLYDKITFEPATDDCFFELKNVIIGKQFHWERSENQQFKGKLHFIVENQQITAINEIDIEIYLESVISSEMSATASEELLKAHAVISRSWLLFPMWNKAAQQHLPTATRTPQSYITWYERDAHAHFDVCADDHCQRYQGITRQVTEKAHNAVHATRGQVLSSDGKICDARFSKSCGGVTELFENCWAETHYPY